MRLSFKEGLYDIVFYGWVAVPSRKGKLINTTVLKVKTNTMPMPGAVHPGLNISCTAGPCVASNIPVEVHGPEVSLAEVYLIHAGVHGCDLLHKGRGGVWFRVALEQGACC